MKNLLIMSLFALFMVSCGSTDCNSDAVEGVDTTAAVVEEVVIETAAVEPATVETPVVTDEVSE